MNASPHFAQTYAEARDKFLAAGAERGARMFRDVHPSERGAQGEELSIDGAKIGDDKAPALLLLTSGTHGVEGLCGSGCQAALLADRLFAKVGPAGRLERGHGLAEWCELADVAYGRDVAKKLAGLDIGQTVVVADRACVAVEAMEGTDATIERAATLSNGRRLVIVKVSKPDQDMRFDVPVVGLKTIQVMGRSNAMLLALDAGKTLLFERQRLLEEADRAGIAIVGIE